MASERPQGGETSRVSLKKNTRGLDVIQSVYAFAIALGLTDVFEGSRTFFSDILFGEATDESVALSAMLLANVVLLGLRFFWVPRNLGDLIYRAAECQARGPNAGKAEVDLGNFTISVHLLMILAHGALFFLLCAEFENVVFLTSSHLPLNASLFSGYVLMHLTLLLVNAAWIGLIKIQQAKIERAMLAPDDDLTAGSVWWLNNLISGVIAFAPFAVFASCSADLGRCLAGSATQIHEIRNLAPVSTYQIGVIFQTLVNFVTWLGVSPSNAGLFWVLAILLANSAIDLLTTGQYYLFFEDVEWERQSHSVDPAIARRNSL